MEFYKKIAEQAAERWRLREEIREGKKHKLATEGVAGVESSERIGKIISCLFSCRILKLLMDIFHPLERREIKLIKTGLGWLNFKAIHYC